MDQTYLNWGFALICAMGGWIFRTLWQSVKDLQKADSDLTTKVQAIELLVAGKYITRDELEHMISALFNKMDRIENKLDGKADK